MIYLSDLQPEYRFLEFWILFVKTFSKNPLTSKTRPQNNEPCKTLQLQHGPTCIKVVEFKETIVVEFDWTSNVCKLLMILIKNFKVFPLKSDCEGVKKFDSIRLLAGLWKCHSGERWWKGFCVHLTSGTL